MNSGECGSLKDSPWVWWRDQMPIAPQWAYFDHAAVGPLSGPAASAIRQFTDQASTLGDTVWPQWAAKIEHLRRSVATLLACDAGQICTVPNTTTGINLVAEGWLWVPGDNVILPEGEFPSNLFPWQNQASKGVEVRIVPRRDGRVLVEDLIAQIDQSTRLIAVSWVGYASGFRVDIDALVQQAHQRGVLVFLDAIQGLGMYDLNLERTPVDFLAADGHKWLLGPEGYGVAMIRQEHLEKIRCGNVGWSSVKNSFNYATPTLELRDTAARFEPGSANMVGATALSASLELFMKVREAHGANAIEERVLGLVQRLDHELRACGVTTRLPASTENQSGILTFDVPGTDPNEVRNQALAEHVVVSCRDGGVRASVHAYNNEDDIDRLVAVVRNRI